MLKQRIISAFFMLLVFLLFNFGAGDFVFSAVVSAMAGLCGWEWSRLSGVQNQLTHKILGLGIGVLTLLVLTFIPFGSIARWLSICAFLFWMSVPLLLYIKPHRASTTDRADIRLIGMGVFLIVSCAFFLDSLHGSGKIGSPWICLYVLAIAWVMDVGAYFSGKRWGKTKLAPKISPGKTWEGAAGGLVLTLLCLVLLLMFSAEARMRWVAVVVGTVLAAIASILGDLYESRLKRAANMKDSSDLIPGHGGVLDRVDGQLASMPVFAFAWIWL